MNGNSAAQAVEILICTTCHRGRPDESPRPGARLHEALAEMGLPEGVVLRAVECLANCDRGCSIVLRGPGRWTYVYGNFSGPEDAELIRDMAGRYRQTADGLVPWRERAQHFRKNCIARIPPQEATA